MIARDVAAAAGRHFDLVVVGGGVLGAMTALLAAGRGVATVLVERHDFGAGATWNSLRILHGGLRSLQRMDVAGRRESADESAFLRERFPELVEPLECVLPLDGHGAWRAPLAGAAVALDRMLPGGSGARGERARLLDPGELRRLHPGAGAADAGLLWRDTLLRQPGRLVIETLRWAVSAGAVALSRVEATGLLVGGGRVEGLAARDLQDGGSLELRGPAVAWCAGGCSPPALREGAAPVPPKARVLAFNVLLARELPEGRALAVRSRGGPGLFLVPVDGATLAGTTYVPDAGHPSSEDVERFVGELASAAPFLSIRPAAVLRVLSGHLPAGARGAAPARRALHEPAAPAEPRGLCRAWPVKLTTARREAERLLRHLGFGSSSRGLPERPAPHLVPAATEASRLATTDPAHLAALAARITAEECVLEREDLLLRRTDWTLDPRRARLLEPALAGVLARLEGSAGR